MKFLEKFQDFLNHLLYAIVDRCHKMIPQFVFLTLGQIKHAPIYLLEKVKFLSHILLNRLKELKNELQVKIKYLLGSITELIHFLRSDEFKNNKKAFLIQTPTAIIKNNKLIASGVLTCLILGIFTFKTIFQKSLFIKESLKASRSIASVEEHNEQTEGNRDLVLDIHSHKVMIEVGSDLAKVHGNEAPNPKVEMFLSAKITLKDREFLGKKEMIENNVLHFPYKVSIMPITPEDLKNLTLKVHQEILKEDHLDLKQSYIAAIELNFEIPSRKNYYRQQERLYSLKDLDLQVFLEDHKRNKQVYIDLTLLTSNRNVILFLKDQEIKLRDRMTTNVEPIIPKLPIEDEGKRIIKDKVRDEINEMLSEEHIEGKILDVYVDFVLSS